MNRRAALHTDLDVTSVDDGLAKQLVEVVERVAYNMTSQGVANTLNAFSKLQAVADAMLPAGWAALAMVPTMNEQKVANPLNALKKLGAAAGAMSPAGWAALVRAAERMTAMMNAHGVTNTLNALGEVEAAAGAMLPAGWDALARAAERTAPTMNAQNAASTLNAPSKLRAVAGAMSPAGWAAMTRVAERTTPTMNEQAVNNTWPQSQVFPMCGRRCRYLLGSASRPSHQTCSRNKMEVNEEETDVRLARSSCAHTGRARLLCRKQRACRAGNGIG